LILLNGEEKTRQGLTLRKTQDRNEGMEVW